MELKLIEFLGAGGDLATIALLFIMWRFDRRLYALELTQCKKCSANRREYAHQETE